jgi:hypothetical protein
MSIILGLSFGRGGSRAGLDAAADSERWARITRSVGDALHTRSFAWSPIRPTFPATADRVSSTPNASLMTLATCENE